MLCNCIWARRLSQETRRFRQIGRDKVYPMNLFDREALIKVCFDDCIWLFNEISFGVPECCGM